jgi:ubiquinone/menaquinone biosynthesis C-methylase UbiE
MLSLYSNQMEIVSTMNIFNKETCDNFSFVEYAWNSYARFYDFVQPFAISLFRLFGNLSYDEFEEKFVELANVQPGQTVLDVACGTGRSHQALKQRLGAKGKLMAVDFSSEMLTRAKARGRQLKLRNIRYQQVHAERLSDSFEEESFEAVLCCNGMPSFPHPRRALTEMAYVLRPGGTLTFSTVNRDKTDESLFMRWSMKFPPGRFPHMEEFKRALRQLGLSRIKFHEQGSMIIVTARKRG